MASVMAVRRLAVRIRMPSVQAQWRRGYATAKVFSDDFAEDDLSLPPSPEALMKHPKKPKRRWMSISDLVTEVEMAMITGSAQPQKGGKTYTNLEEELVRLRMENDRISERIVELKALRLESVKAEEEATKKFYSADGFAAHKADMVKALKEIEEIDFELAGLRYQNKVNILDVGLLKRTMTRIEKRAAVTNLVNKFQGSFLAGEAVHPDSPEVHELSALMQSMRTEYDDVVAKVEDWKAYNEEFRSRLDAAQALCLDVRDTPGGDADNARAALIGHLHEATRMNLQLTRLRDIQLLDSQEMALLERVQGKLESDRRRHKLLAEGSEDDIRHYVNTLQDQTRSLRQSMQHMEATLDVSDKEISRIVSRLRELKMVTTPETSELREKLIACVHEEQQCLGRLAVLRGIKHHKILWLAKLKSALPE